MNAQLRLPFVLLAGALALVSLQGCTTKEGTDPTPAASVAKTPGTPPAATTAAPGTPNGFGVPLAANKCPSAAPGSSTTVKETPDGVEVTVLAPGGTPINDIRQRGVQIVAASKDPATGAGSAADGLAKCPIVVKDMIITETDIPGGAMFTVKPKSAAGAADLKKETKSRAATYVPETLTK